MIFVFTRKKLMKLMCAAAALICAVIMIGNGTLQATFNNTTSNDWGLSYRENGKTPEGNASKEFLKQYNAYYAGEEKDKVIYLTFDAGYENGYTESILNTLKKHNIKAAFFLVGNYLETQPDLVKRMCEEGHIVGNHTYSHPDMSKISEEAAFREEIERFEQGFRMLTNRELPRLYRPLQGKFSEENLKQAKDLGYQTVFWSLAYVDWYNDNRPKAEDAMKTLTSRIHPGAIVLLHSTSETNAQILDELLCKWKEMGYTFAPLTELTN